MPSEGDQQPILAAVELDHRRKLVAQRLGMPEGEKPNRREDARTLLDAADEEADGHERCRTRSVRTGLCARRRRRVESQHERDDAHCSGNGHLR